MPPNITPTPNTKLKQLTNAKKSAILKDSNIAFKKWGAPPAGAALFLSICKHYHRKGVVTDACQWKRNPAETHPFPCKRFCWNSTTTSVPLLWNGMRKLCRRQLMRKSCCKIAMYWKSFTLWAAVSPRKQNRRKFHAEKRI